MMRVLLKTGLIGLGVFYLLTTLIIVGHSTRYRINGIKISEGKVDSQFVLVTNFTADFDHEFRLRDLSFNVREALEILDGPPGEYCKPKGKIKVIKFEIINPDTDQTRNITDLVSWDTTQTNWFNDDRKIGELAELSYKLSSDSQFKQIQEFINSYNSVDSIYSDDDVIHGYGNKDYYFIIRQLRRGTNPVIKMTIEFSDGKTVTNKIEE